MTTPQTRKARKPKQISPILTPEQETAAAVETRDRIKRLYRVNVHTVQLQARGDWSHYGPDIYATHAEACAAIRGFAESSCFPDEEDDCKGMPHTDDENIDDLIEHLTEHHGHTVELDAATLIVPAASLVPCDEHGEAITDIRQLPPEANVSEGGQL